MRQAVPCALLLLLAACSNAPVRIESRALADEVSKTPEHFIVAAVDNNPSAFVARAGSTPRGYDSVASYGPSVSARRTMLALENDYGLKEVSAWPIEPLHMHCAVLEIPGGTDRATLLEALAHDSRIRLAQPLQSFSTQTQSYNDPYVGLQRGFAQMNVADAHPMSRGDGVKVAIIDTGADTQHPDLRGNIVRAANFVDSDDRQFQQDRHGTEIAGVIAAVANNREGIVGVAPGAQLLLFKACWQLKVGADAARCNSFTLARALVAAFEAHAQIVNLSVAGPADPLLSDLIREGQRRGVLFVGAAAAEPFDAQGALVRQADVIEVASSGARASNLALQAPGREILTLLPGGHYDFASGDSIATAEVSGVLALLLAKKSDLSAAEALRLLRADARDGIASVDACSAVARLTGRGGCDAVGERMAEEHPGRGELH